MAHFRADCEIYFLPPQEMLRWRSFQDLPDEELRSSREDISTHQERKCSFEERRRQVEEEARRSFLEEQRRLHLRREEERRISLEAEVSSKLEVITKSCLNACWKF